MSVKECVSCRGLVSCDVFSVLKRNSWWWSDLCRRSAFRCSQQVNATQEEQNVVTITLLSPRFGKTEVESRMNISRGRFNTLECVATVEGEQAYTLFSISGEWRYHTRAVLWKVLSQRFCCQAVSNMFCHWIDHLHVLTFRLRVATKSTRVRGHAQTDMKITFQILLTLLYLLSKNLPERPRWH